MSSAWEPSLSFIYLKIIFIFEIEKIIFLFENQYNVFYNDIECIVLVLDV